VHTVSTIIHIHTRNIPYFSNSSIILIQCCHITSCYTSKLGTKRRRILKQIFPKFFKLRDPSNTLQKPD